MTFKICKNSPQNTQLDNLAGLSKILYPAFLTSLLILPFRLQPEVGELATSPWQDSNVAASADALEKVPGVRFSVLPLAAPNFTEPVDYCFFLL